MARAIGYRTHNVVRQDRDDGTVLLSSGYPLGKVSNSTGEWLRHWANHAPDRVFLAERYGPQWRQVSYLSAHQQVREIASWLIASGLSDATPIAILSGNGIDHGLLALAAQYVGIPIVPVAEQYSLIPGAHARLQHAIELVNPALIYVVDASLFEAALSIDALQGINVVASHNSKPGMTPFSELLKGNPSVNIDAVYTSVGPTTVAKILLTSGSTSNPKGVITTQQMLCVNQTQICDAMPWLQDRPPVIVDWLPWNHVFGGSHNFNLILANGGSLYIDDGKPVKGLFSRTLENLSMISGTLSFNVPVGFAMLLTAARKDEMLRQRFFNDLDMLFYAGASLPQDVWQGLESLALQTCGRIPLMTSSWGLTETAPAALSQHEPTQRSGVVGVPMTGVTIKLIPDGQMRCEVRIKGPNVTPGYFEDPQKTKQSFDDEGYFITGDAMRFVQLDDANKGLCFDGRLSEDFKLLTGTWVQASNLRLELLEYLAPLALDLVVTGQNRHQVGVLIFPNRDFLQQTGIVFTENGTALFGDQLFSEIIRRLSKQKATGSSSHVTRALVLSTPASMADGETTAKGNLNFQTLLTRRHSTIDRLYNDNDPATITI